MKSDHVKDLVTVLSLVGVAAFFASIGMESLAATALGGCLSYVVPRAREVPPVALGLVCAVASVGIMGH